MTEEYGKTLAIKETHETTGEYHLGYELENDYLRQLQQFIDTFNQKLCFDAVSSKDALTMPRHVETLVLLEN